MLQRRLGTRLPAGDAERESRRSTFPTVLAGVAGVLIAMAALAAPPWEFTIGLPEPGYPKSDGTTLRFTEFKGTRIDWGQCMDDDRILEVAGSSWVRSWGFKGFVTIPAGREACIQAVVVGLDGDELGRSDPVRVSTIGPRKNPLPPIITRTDIEKMIPWQPWL